MRDWQGISEAISAAIERPFSAGRGRGLGGGCINQAVCLEGDGIHYFVKLNEKALLPMFEAEAAGLAAIADSGAIRVPTPIAAGVAEGQAWLAMEHIDLCSGNSRSSSLLGEQLAALHRSSADAFGGGRDNTIGTTNQVNTRSSDWINFYREHRLGFQLRLATAQGASTGLIDAGQRLMDSLPHFFESYKPAPALLHGDLWSGNTAADETGAPVLFDPAVYCGDREADLAMTELFGGFDERFYHSYRSSWDIDPGYSTRKVLYHLYHVLNHFNLFGGVYARQAEEMVARLLAET